MWRPLELIENTYITSPRPFSLLFLTSILTAILTAPHVLLCASAPLRFSVSPPRIQRAKEFAAK